MLVTTNACILSRMNTTGRRIAQARESKGLNQSELARRLGVTPQSVQAWESGKNVPRHQKLASIAEMLGVSVSYLMGESSPTRVSSRPHNESADDMFADIQPPEFLLAEPHSGWHAIDAIINTPNKNADLIEIPKFDVRASMGDGCALSDGYIDLIQRMTVSLEWLKQQSLIYTSPDNLAIITGDGDSMSGTFNHGDALLVDRGVTELRSDAVYVFAIDGEIFIKRLQRLPGGDIRVISDNKLYESYTIADGLKDRFMLLARVLLVWNAKKL